MDIAVVHWLDAMSKSYEISASAAHDMEALPMITVGFLIRNDAEGSRNGEEVVTVAQDYSAPEDEVQYRHTTVIPKSYVTHIEIKEFDA